MVAKRGCAFLLDQTLLVFLDVILSTVQSLPIHLRVLSVVNQIRIVSTGSELLHL